MLKENATVDQEVYVYNSEDGELNTSYAFKITFIDEKKSTYEVESLDGNIMLKDLILEDMELVSENE